jgi:IS4 transposase
MSQSRLKPFTAALERPNGSGNWTYLFVPFDVEAVYGSRGRVAVRGAIDGKAFRGSLMPRGDGRHFVVVNKELRTAIGKEAPAEVVVELEPDHEPRVVPVPELFLAALSKSKAAKEVFERLSYSHQREYVAWIEDAKKTETQERRASKAVEMLLAGKGIKSSLPKA